VTDKPSPWATIDGDGVRVHIPDGDGGEIAFTLNVENALSLVGSVSEKLAALKTPAGKKQLAKSVLGWLVTPRK
jgi:hypothetical protein